MDNLSNRAWSRLGRGRVEHAMIWGALPSRINRRLAYVVAQANTPWINQRKSPVAAISPSPWR